MKIDKNNIKMLDFTDYVNKAGKIRFDYGKDKSISKLLKKFQHYFKSVKK